MSFQIVVHQLARDDLRSAYEWAAERAPTAALLWLNRFELALQTLTERPERCPLARENGKVGVELREFLFGKRPWVFRVLFVMDGDVVRILRIRRAQRQFLSTSELRDALNDLTRGGPG